MTALDFIPGAIGLFMGFLFGVSGFDDNGKTVDLAKNPRVKNFLWILGGAASVLLADWKLLGSADDAGGDRAHLLLAYLVGAVVAVFLTLGLTTCFIIVSMLRRARRQPIFRHQVLNVVMAYLRLGYGGYSRKIFELEAAGQSTTPDGVMGETGRAVAILIAAAALERNRNDAELRSTIMNQVLGAIEDTVKLFASDVDDLEIKTNYMVIKGLADLAGAEPLFLQHEPGHYPAFLVTRRYRNGAAGTACLPLGLPAERDTVLPGAPSCAVSREGRVLNTRKIDMPSGINKKVQTEIKGFFKDVWYLSVLSVPLVAGENVVGVVNIETNHIDVVGKGTDMISSIGAALAPHCLILGELVARGEQ